MPQAFWKGYLKLSLVTCAVELAPATSDSEKVRDARTYFDGIADAKPDSALLELVEKLIKQDIESWDASLLRDPVQENLKSMIAAKQKRRKRKPKEAQPQQQHGGNVIDIMQALRDSLRGSARK